MKKIPTLFQRSEDRRSVVDIVTPGCEWVLNGEGVATRKYDGTCVLIDENGQPWARREVKPGKDAPPNFRLEEHDDTTGKSVGWEPADQSSYGRYINEAMGDPNLIARGTYELCGPKVQGNPEGYDGHVLIYHDTAEVIERPPLTFSGLRDWMQRTEYEGIVWHHPDGRMAKLKRRDFPKATR